MPSFDGGLFGLGFGSPDNTEAEPDITKLSDALNNIDNKIYDGIIERIQEPAKILGDLDTKVTDRISKEADIPVESVKMVDRFITNSTGQKVEELSNAVGKLNVLARERGIDLTALANEGLKNPVGGGLVENIRGKTRRGGPLWEKPPVRPAPFLEQGQLFEHFEAWLDANGFKWEHFPFEVLPGGVDIHITPLPITGIKPFVFNENVPIPGQEDPFPGLVEQPFPGEEPPVMVEPLEDEDPFIRPQPRPGPGVGDTPIEITEGWPEGVPLFDPSLTEDTQLPWITPAPITQEQPITLPDGDGCTICQQPVCICQQPEGGEYHITEEQNIVGDTVNNYYESVENLVNVMGQEFQELPEEPPAPEWCAYCNNDEGRLIVLKKTPNTPVPVPPGFTLIACGSTAAEALIASKDQCITVLDTLHGKAGAIDLFDPLGLCDLHSYAPGGKPIVNVDPFLQNNPISAILGWGSSTEQSLGTKILTELGRFHPIGQIFRVIFNLFAYTASGVQKTTDELMRPYFTAGTAMPGMLTARLIIGVLEQWLSTDFGKFKQPLVYATDAMSPQLFPDAQQAQAAYIAGDIDPKTYRLWVQQNDYCWEPWRRLDNAARTKLAPLTALTAKWRNLISPAQYEGELKNAGYMYPWQREAIEGANKFVPPITDLIRFMVRDVFDPAVRDIYAPDTDFNNKWNKMSPKYGDMQGISSEIAELYWRAHWIIPSTGQLYDIYHRNRTKDQSDPKTFTLPKLKEALRINDNNPYFLPYLIERSHHLLTRVDVRRAYRLGAITIDEVLENYIKRGYTDRAAKALQDYAKEDKIQFLLGRKEVKLLRDGAISFDKFRDSMRRYDPNAEQLSYIIDLVSLEREGVVRKKCLKALEKQYQIGTYTAEEVVEQLDDMGYEPEEVGFILDGFNCYVKARGKTLSAAKICKMYKQHLFNAAEFRERLENIGYNPDDAWLLLMSCEEEIDAKDEKDKAKALKDKERKEEKEAKDAAREEKKEKRKNLVLINNRAKRAKAENRREIRILKVITNLARCAELDLDDSGQAVRDALVQIQFIYDFTSEERTSILERTVERCIPKTIEEFTERWKELADEMFKLEPLDLNHVGNTISPNIIDTTEGEGNNGTVR